MVPPKKRSKIGGSDEASAETSLENIEESTYGLNDIVYCNWNAKWYEAKIISVTTKNGQIEYEVHYQGWNKRYDEVISENDAKKRFSKTKPAKDESKKPSGSEKSKQKTKNGVEKKSSVEPSKPIASFDSLTNEDLAFILCEENEKITKGQLIPIVPAKVSIEQIIFKFLESKSIDVNDEITRLFENSENIVPQSSNDAEVIASLVTLFNHVFSRLLTYEEEKEIFKNLVKEESNGSSPSYYRYSKSFGFTYLLRFVSRLSNILVGSSIWNKKALENINKSASELNSFLAANIGNFYSEADYYQPQK